MAVSDWEPLLDDDRVGRIADLLFLAYPDLPRDSDIFTFVVPPQTQVLDDDVRDIPEQAVFAIKSKNPRTWDPFYRGKEILSTSGMWKRTWDAQEKNRSHYVSGADDPAFNVFRVCAVNHLEKLRNLRELI